MATKRLLIANWITRLVGSFLTEVRRGKNIRHTDLALTPAAGEEFADLDLLWDGARSLAR